MSIDNVQARAEDGRIEIGLFEGEECREVIPLRAPEALELRDSLNDALREAGLLESYRIGKKVRKRTLVNLSGLADEQIEAIRGCSPGWRCARWRSSPRWRTPDPTGRCRRSVSPCSGWDLRG